MVLILNAIVFMSMVLFCNQYNIHSIVVYSFKVHFNFICCSKDDSEEVIQALRHYTQAEVDGRILYDLYDDAHVKVSSSF